MRSSRSIDPSQRSFIQHRVIECDLSADYGAAPEGFPALQHRQLVWRSRVLVANTKSSVRDRLHRASLRYGVEQVQESDQHSRQDRDFNAGGPPIPCAEWQCSVTRQHYMQKVGARGKIFTSRESQRVGRCICLERRATCTHARAARDEAANAS